MGAIPGSPLPRHPTHQQHSSTAAQQDSRTAGQQDSRTGVDPGRSGAIWGDPGRSGAIRGDPKSSRTAKIQSKVLSDLWGRFPEACFAQSNPSAAQQHSSTAAQQHSSTAAQQDSRTALQQDSRTAGQQDSRTAGQPKSRNFGHKKWAGGRNGAGNVQKWPPKRKPGKTILHNISKNISLKP